MRIVNKGLTLLLVLTVTVGLAPIVIGASNPSNDAVSQLWSKTYGKGEADSVLQTSDSGYALGGGYIAGLVKTDSYGNQLWSQTFEETHASFMVQTSDGGYVIAGYTGSPGVNLEMSLVKTDSYGNRLWNKTYGGAYDDEAYSVIQTSDGGYAIVGSNNVDGMLNDDMYLVKTDSSGNRLWEKSYGGDSLDEGFSIVQTGDGGYAMAGVYGFDAWLVKTDSMGNQLWSKTYGVGAANYIIQTTDGGYALAGYTGPSIGYFSCLIKTDASGNQLWSQTFRGTGRMSYDEARCVVQTADGGYALATSAHSGSTFGEAALLIKTDSAGNQQWNITTYGASANSIIQTSDHGYALAGSKGGAWLLRVPNGTAPPVTPTQSASPRNPPNVFQLDCFGVIIAVDIIVVVILAVSYLFYRRHRKRKGAQPEDKTRVSA